jgi:hypothetical protein
MELVDSQVRDEGQDGTLGYITQSLYTYVSTQPESCIASYPSTTVLGSESRIVQWTAIRDKETEVEQWATQPSGTSK